MRDRSGGRHWIDRASEQIDHSSPNFPHLFCITDVRYDEYEKDEVYWIKNELKGKLVHLTKEGSPAANSFEEENDPRLQEKADYKIVWPDCNSNQKEINKHLRPRVLQFIDWLLENEKKKKI